MTESLLWILVVQIVQTVTRPSTSRLPPCLVDPMAFLSVALRHFYPVGKALSFPSSVLLDDDTVEGLDWSSLTWGEACVRTGAARYTAAGDTETTDVRFRSRTAEHVTGGFHSLRQVGAV